MYSHRSQGSERDSNQFMRVSYLPAEESPTSIDRGHRHMSKRATRFAQVDNGKNSKSCLSEVSSDARGGQRGGHSRQLCAVVEPSREPGGGRVSRKRSKSRAPPRRRDDFDGRATGSFGTLSARSGSSSKTGNSERCGLGKGLLKKKLDAKVFALSMELIDHVSKGQLELAEEKIKKGVSPNYADYDKRTPLHLAAAEGHLDVVNMLLENGANVNVEDRWGSKPYDEAVKNRFPEIASILKGYHEEEEEDTLVKEHHDGLELLEYCARGFQKSVREKIAAGTKAHFADYDLRTPLHLAACEGHEKIVEVLLRNGADAYFKDRFGHSAVDDAMMNGMLKVLEVMEMAGVKIPEHIFDKSCTPEFERNMLLIDVCAKGNAAKAMKLLKGGANARFGDYDMRTPLHLACAEGHVNVVQVLLQAGACVAAEDRWKATPFDEAVMNGHEEVVRVLQEESRSPGHSTGWDSRFPPWDPSDGASVIVSRSS